MASRQLASVLHAMVWFLDYICFSFTTGATTTKMMWIDIQ